MEQPTNVEFVTDQSDDTAFLLPAQLYVDQKRDRIGVRYCDEEHKFWQVPLSDVLALLRKATIQTP